jgi:hypothetical protein
MSQLEIKEANSQELAIMQISQLPKIKENITIIGQEISKKLEELNLENMVATPDSIQVLKSTRADLNKSLKAYMDQDKEVKNALQAPYVEIKDKLKEEVLDKIKSGVDILKDKITAFEDKIKQEKKENLQVFFLELCEVETIDFIKFEDIIPEIKLSVTEKKYKEQITAYIEKVNDELALIDTNEHKAEILVEYKKTLNAAKAIRDVQDRKQKEDEERERMRQVTISLRKNDLVSKSFSFNEITNSFMYNENIYIGIDDIEDLSDEIYQKEVIKLDQQIADFKKEQLAQKAAQTTAPPPNWKPKPKPVAAPEVKKVEKLTQAKFKVVGTAAQLLALGEYMKSNGLKYENLK